MTILKFSFPWVEHNQHSSFNSRLILALVNFRADLLNSPVAYNNPADRLIRRPGKNSRMEKMSAISGAELQAVSDSIAKQKQILDTAVGTTTTADSILYGMQANADRIDGYGEDAIADLYKAFVGEKAQMPSFKLELMHQGIMALENHFQRLEGQSISEYWEAQNSTRMCPEFAQLCRSIGLYIDPSLVFAPQTSMGSFAVSGVDTGVFTDGSAIDGNLYGPADCEGIITAVGGASVSLVATVTGTDENGATVTGTITFSSAVLNDTVDFVPDQTGKQLQDVTNVTITGGADGDGFTVRSKADRSPSL